MMGKRWFAVAGAVLALCVLARPALADTLDKIKERRSIAIGVKADMRPWGYLNPAGNVIGFELDLAKDIADRLGVQFEPVVVQSSNRIQFLDQGKIDLIIATMYDTPERRRAVDMIEPHYTSAATNVLAPKSQHVTSWEQLKGRKVCGQQGSIQNKWLAQKYGADLLVLPTVEEDYAALRAGNCMAFVYIDLLLQLAAEDKTLWADYEVPLPSEDQQYHSIGVRKGEGEQAFGKTISAIIVDWHRSGKLMALWKKWGIPDSAFLEQMHAKYSVSK